MEKNKKIAIVLIIIIILIPLLFILKKGDNPKQDVSVVSKSKVVKLYKNTDNKCTDIIPDATKNEKLLLYLSFNQMKKDKVLSDKINYEDYLNSSRKVLKEEDIPKTFDNYLFEGYTYTLKENKITRKEKGCDKKFVSKMYGYTSKDNYLYVDVINGYILDNKVYDYKNNELGDYSTNTLNKTLDKGKAITLTYTLEKDNYKLEKVGER